MIDNIEMLKRIIEAQKLMNDAIFGITSTDTGKQQAAQKLNKEAKRILDMLKFELDSIKIDIEESEESEEVELPEIPVNTEAEVCKASDESIASKPAEKEVKETETVVEVQNTQPTESSTENLPKTETDTTSWIKNYFDDFMGKALSQESTNEKQEHNYDTRNKRSKRATQNS